MNRIRHGLPQFNDTVWSFYNQLAGDGPLLNVLYKISDKRGHYNDEQQGEINGLARLSGLPLKFVQSIQMLYEVRLRRGGGCIQKI